MISHSILLVGEEGSGQVEYASKLAKDNCLIMTESCEHISDTIPTLYCIDLGTVDCNSLLKVFEEPNENQYFVLYNDVYASDTIRTRATIVKMNVPTREELMSASNNPELAIKVCKSLGQIEIANKHNLTALFQLCDTICTKLDSAPMFNVLNITERVFNKDEIDISLFMRVLGYCIVKNRRTDWYPIYNNVNKTVGRVVDKRSYVDHMLMEMKYANK